MDRLGHGQIQTRSDQWMERIPGAKCCESTEGGATDPASEGVAGFMEKV